MTALLYAIVAFFTMFPAVGVAAEASKMTADSGLPPVSGETSSNTPATPVPPARISQQPATDAGAFSPGSARGHPSQEDRLSPGSARGHPSQEDRLSPGSARGHPSQEDRLSPGSAREYPSQEDRLSPASARGYPAQEDTPATTVGGISGLAQTGSADFENGNLSLNFQDIEVRAALQLIADFTGLNLVASDRVTGRITLRLKAVPWQRALTLILKMRGLDQRRDGDVILIAPAEEIAAREQLELANQQQLAELAPLVSEFIQIRYANAANLLAMFAASGGQQPMLSERGGVIVDERTNAIILTDTAANIDAFRRVIRQLDVPQRQVLIESRIVTTNKNFSEQLGIRWGGGAIKSNGSSLLRYGGSLATLAGLNDSGAGPNDRIGVSYPEGLAVDLGVSRSGSSSFGVGITGEGYLVDLEISALAAEGDAEVVARPQIVTADKSPAVIESGVEIPYQEATSSGATSTAFKDAVLSLQVTPRITADDHIVMLLDVKQDTVGQIYNGIPSVNTNQIRTEVLVNDGQTVVLGGIFQTIRNVSTEKTPLLGDVPQLGRLFRRQSERDDEQELLVFITPSILRQ